MPFPSHLLKLAPMLLALPGLSACATYNPGTWQQPQLAKPSPTQNKLLELPGSGKRVAVAVYGFTDQTGQFKPTDNVQTLSRAVTQGATSILVKALQDAGNRQFFQVIERERLDNVLRERAVIREMRASYLGEKQVNPQALPPLLFAGLLLEGGIIGFDSNVKTGGAGARFLGIGGNGQYREDTVTLYLRAVSVKTGEVLTSVNVRKSIASVALGANAFRYVGFKDLLELETGVTYNEPDQLAVQQAVEKAVYALIMEGALQDLWCFGTTDEYSGNLLKNYVAERDSIKTDKAALPVRTDGSRVSGACRTAAPRAAAIRLPVSPAAM
ncbi:CsgG/HfaB family protein [Rhizorhapis sp.]|uniref:CsgG/HfaB family protein n=1 Tax=Rhizorhapis sp. TaxID=1968842 RepID=UPI002B4A303F|nr:CsgG/HfaB family protein [Rhizorhapis sp.]HKR17185.1 CsgG/HfaB family protein [Rhizorhapis sp.]